MNTSFLSTLPAAPRTDQVPSPRSARAKEAAADPEVSDREPTGDSDKADAFAEMLAAMISNADPHVETVVPAAEAETVSSVSTDIPRDGAGSPLFGASYTASTSEADTSVATTTMPGPVDFMATMEATTEVAGEPGQAGEVLSEAAAQEMAAVGAESTESMPNVSGSAGDIDLTAVDADGTADVEPGQEAHVSTETEQPVLTVRETIVQPAEVQPERPEAPDSAPAMTRDLPVESVPTPVADPVELQSADAFVSPPEMTPPAEAPVVETLEPVQVEARSVEAQSAAPAETATAVGNVNIVEEPSEDLQVEEDHGSAPKPASSRPSTMGSTAGPESLSEMQPEIVAVVKPSPEVGVQNDVSRDRLAVPVEMGESAVAAPLDPEALLATGATNPDVSAAGTPDGVVSSTANSSTAAKPTHVSQQVLQALAAYESQVPQNGSRTFEMLLDPPELGRLLIQMSRTSKGVDVRISAENETVRSILATSGSDLQQSLQLSGFDLGQFSGSDSGGDAANGEEWVAAPTLQSFATPVSAPLRSSSTTTSGNSAVNVVV